MKLDPDCIRDVLMVVEDNATVDTWVDTKAFTELAKKYGGPAVSYHVRQADWAGLFSKMEKFIGGGFIIQDLSPQGHEFLANIRQDTNWNKTKQIASKVGSTSLSTLTTVASSVISDLIQKNLHLG